MENHGCEMQDIRYILNLKTPDLSMFIEAHSFVGTAISTDPGVIITECDQNATSQVILSKLIPLFAEGGFYLYLSFVDWVSRSSMASHWVNMLLQCEGDRLFVTSTYHLFDM